MESVKFGIVLPTFRRDDETPKILRNALLSILEQDYQNWHLFLIGDNYQPVGEFFSISSTIPPDKITTINNPVATERSIYETGSRHLRASGGVNSTNMGIELALSAGIDWVCRLDHDDWWSSTHLSDFAYVIRRELECAFVISNGTHLKTTLPHNYTNDVHKYFPITPKGGTIVHSTTCINFSKIPFRYRDVYAETGKIEAADADMWNRMEEYLSKHGLKAFCTNVLSAFNTYENGKKLNNSYDHLMPINKKE